MLFGGKDLTGAIDPELRTGAPQAFQLCWTKGTSQDTSTLNNIIKPVTNPAQKTRMGFYFSNENPAGEKFIACKNIAEGLSSCWSTQTLHVFTTTFPKLGKQSTNTTQQLPAETVPTKEPST